MCQRWRCSTSRSPSCRSGSRATSTRRVERPGDPRLRHDRGQRQPPRRSCAARLDHALALYRTTIARRGSSSPAASDPATSTPRPACRRRTSSRARRAGVEHHQGLGQRHVAERGLGDRGVEATDHIVTVLYGDRSLPRVPGHGDRLGPGPAAAARRRWRNSPTVKHSLWRYYLSETVAVGVGRVVGYRTL